MLSGGSGSRYQARAVATVGGTRFVGIESTTTMFSVRYGF